MLPRYSASQGQLRLACTLHDSSVLTVQSRGSLVSDPVRHFIYRLRTAKVGQETNLGVVEEVCCTLQSSFSCYTRAKEENVLCEIIALCVSGFMCDCTCMRVRVSVCACAIDV